LIGHEGGVTAVAVAADGRGALSGSRDGTLRLWDLSTEQPLLSFGGTENLVTAVAITPDGRRAVCGSFDGTINLWDLQTGGLVRMITGPRSHGTAVEIELDGRTIVTGRSQVSDPRVSAVAITPDGKRVVSGSRDNTGDLRLWDLLTGDLCLTLAGHEDDVTAVAVAPDGRHVPSAPRDRTLRLRDLEGRAGLAILPLESALMAIAPTAGPSRSGIESATSTFRRSMWIGAWPAPHQAWRHRPAVSGIEVRARRGVGMDSATVSPPEAPAVPAGPRPGQPGATLARMRRAGVGVGELYDEVVHSPRRMRSPGRSSR
jgi:hypothetical protein